MSPFVGFFSLEFYMVRFALLFAVGLSTITALAQDDASAVDQVPVDEEAAPSPVTYRLDPSQGLLMIKVFKDESTLLASMSHNHAIKANGWSGSVLWNATDASSCSVEISVPVNQLDPDPPDARRAAGLEGGPDEGDREKIKKSMLNDDQLDGEKYATIAFQSSGCKVSDDGVEVSGGLTIRGVTQQITVPMKIEATESSLSVQGGFKVKATDFGFEPFSAMLGQLRNADEMEFVIDVRGSVR